MKRELTLGEQVLEIARKFPSHDALSFDGVNYSYSELSESVAQWFKALKDSKSYEQRIGVYATNNFESYTALIAISAYGASFVPLNPEYPKDRLEQICREAKLSTILNGENIAQEIGLNAIKKSSSGVDPSEMLPCVNQSGSYVIFTSGTTGGPKGVEIDHGHINSFFRFIIQSENWRFDEKDRVLQAFELTFDMSIFALFLPLLSGGCAVIVPLKKIRFLEIAKALTQNNISVVILVPTVLNFLLPYLEELKLDSVRYSFFAGDKLLHSVCSTWSEKIPNAEIVNMYGPTETTIASTFYPWQQELSAAQSKNDIVPIGQAFPMIETAVVDGELCMRGAQIIESYINNANEDKFVSLDKGVRYYRTGDLVEPLAEANFLFAGRRDQQVKINGYRIELAELDNFVRKRVQSNFYLHAHKPINQPEQLLLFIEGSSSDEYKELMNDLNHCFPMHMIPLIVMVEEIPLNINSKVDVVSLLEKMQLS